LTYCINIAKTLNIRVFWKPFGTLKNQTEALSELGLFCQCHHVSKFFWNVWNVFKQIIDKRTNTTFLRESCFEYFMIFRGSFQDNVIIFWKLARRWKIAKRWRW